MSKATTTPAPKRTNKTVTPDEQGFIIEGLRKLALQRDTLVKYASDEDSDSFDEDKAEAYADDIVAIRALLIKLGDLRPVVLKSERKAKAKANAKAKAKASKPKAKATATK